MARGGKDMAAGDTPSATAKLSARHGK